MQYKHYSLGELILSLPEVEDGLLCTFLAASKNGNLLSLPVERPELEDPVSGEVIGGILHMLEWQQYLFTLASTWLVPCWLIQTLEKLSKSRNQSSVTVLASAHFIWKAPNHFSDVNLLLLEAAKSSPILIYRHGALSGGSAQYIHRHVDRVLVDVIPVIVKAMCLLWISLTPSI